MNDQEYLRTAIFEIIENQINSNNPPEAKKTYDRLLADGYPEEEVMKYIGCVVSTEIIDVLKEGRTFNEKSYVKALQALPKLPWDEE